MRFTEFKQPELADEGMMSFLTKPLAQKAAEKAVASRVPPASLKTSEMPPDIKMLISKVQNKVQLRPDEYSKLQAYKAFKDAETAALKEGCSFCGSKDHTALDEAGKASKELCQSSRPDADLGASNLASCKSQGLRARDGDKSHKLGKGPESRVKVGGHKIKGKKYGGPLPDWGTHK
jgi:hypothetical protein